MTRSFLRDNGLSRVLVALFLLTLAGQTLSGMHVYNDARTEHGRAAVPLGAYLQSGHFGEAVFENWESEFLQMGAYIALTVFLFQRGSAESNDPDDTTDEAAELAAHRDDPDAPGPVRRGGLALALYRYSLVIAFVALFLGSFAGHAVTGLAQQNEERALHSEAPITLSEYAGGAEFWFESLQNWQSEFLSVLAIVLLSVWLRAGRSPESKPVWAPHRKTGAS